MSTSQTLLELRGMRVDLDNGQRVLPLVRDASFEIRRGEIVCLVGESGSGKSVTARTIMGLTQLDSRMQVSGTADFDDVDLFSLGPEAMRRMRGRELAIIFQEPMSSLDPVFTIFSQLREALRRREQVDSATERARILEALTEVGIHDGERVLRSYPHQLSGGMCQRVMIAMALLAKPQLLIADEPTTALDVTIQAQILELIDNLRRTEDMSVLLVTHDMGVAAEVADRVVVMYAGRVVEDASPRAIFAHPRHPYSQGLLECVPPMTGDRPEFLPSISGSVPDPSAIGAGCAFAPRCPRALEKCSTDDPPLTNHDGVAIACHNPVPLEQEVAS